MKRIGIKNAITAKINSMQPNECIPSRKSMCIRYGASRSTIDSIIGELIREGVVYTIQGKGTYVSPNKQDDPPTVWKTRTWALLIPDMRSETYPELYAGLNSYTSEANITLLICNTNNDPLCEYSYIQTLVTSNVSGMIIVPALKGGNDIRGYRYLQSCNIPFVFWNRSFDDMSNVPQVCINGYQGGYLATKHLLNMGYQRITYLAPLRFRSSMDRLFGYCSALHEAGLEVPYEYISLELQDLSERRKHDAVYHYVSSLLDMQEPPDAILCFSDEMVYSVTRAIQAKGLRVSDDVGVIAFESALPSAQQILDYRLTYVSLNSYESGRCAAMILDGLLRGEYGQIPNIRVFHPILVVQDSCKGPQKDTLPAPE